MAVVYRILGRHTPSQYLAFGTFAALAGLGMYQSSKSVKEPAGRNSKDVVGAAGQDIDVAQMLETLLQEEDT